MSVSLRVIAGSARGRELRHPRSATRPTSSRLKEALFSLLAAAALLRSPASELYAGSGALGIEALSRGVQRCTFVEANGENCKVIAGNLERVAVTGGTVMCGRVGHWRPEEGERYALVLADPPYNDFDSWTEIAASISGALTTDATIAIEHRSGQGPPEEVAGRKLWRDRKHGDGSVAIYRPTLSERG